MIQAVGLTSDFPKAQPPAVEDVSFEARSGHVTALLGAAGAGKTTVLRLMLELQRGRGITYFRGRPLHCIAHPSREVGVLLGDVPGHPARTVRGHLRMLCAAAGVPARRADEVLETVGLVSLREERLGTLSLGMDRRLGLACALLPDPHTLVLDEPAAGLATPEARWLHTTLREYVDQGGAVLLATADPKEAARNADHVVTLEVGRIAADLEAEEFARTRLRPRVAVRSPHAARLANLLVREARTERRPVEVVREDGNRLSVYGSTTADVGEAAFRNGILIHQLADEAGDMRGDAEEQATDCAEPAGGQDASSPPDAPQEAAPQEIAAQEAAPQEGAALEGAETAQAPDPLPLPVAVRSLRSPLRPLRYELRRATGIGTGFVICGTALVVSVVTAVVLARIGHTPQARLFAAWPRELPLPPVALAAGLLGALSFGDEFRHPALATDRGTVPRRLGLLTAKLAVCGITAGMLAFLALGCDAELLYLVYGRELVQVPGDWLPLCASWLALVVGCAWAGVLAAGVFRSTAAGLAAVLAVPVAVVPLVHRMFEGSYVRATAGIHLRMREVLLLQWPFGGERYLLGLARVIAQPVGGAMTLSLAALLCAYLITTLRARVR
ncbi:ATP-binding cassette domain-containing protein [Streptomyces sp. BV129]|uniref:ATP-binding cassette domain-containing protein n=1 Tax=Streptomyces sp. BV129 TaxID=2849671 RepID=UPI001C2E6B8E|nr:ATP-binding cassette domain-containing protein [Streptomyces sp. BV129]MBV1949843.1 ATP-binding cassette domain-containing protein [Streptomyces sp. BV129]